MKLLTTIAFVLTLTSCATHTGYPEEVMYDMASILKDVTQAVDGEIKFGDTAGLTNDEIIRNATASNPTLLTRLPELALEGNLSDYRILSEFQGNNAVMLICDGDIALMEDAGCNSAFDKIHWNSPQPNSCEIKLVATDVCAN